MNTRRGNIRAFIAVPIGDRARAALADAAARIRREIPDGIQWANPAGIHLTLKFLGNIPSSAVDPLLESLTPAAAAHPPFTLELAALGTFPHRRNPRVLWAGVGGDTDALSNLQKSIETALTALGHPPESRPFQPHLTLGRPRRGLSPAQLSRIAATISNLAPPPPEIWQASSVELIQSELHPSGARYTVMGSAALGGATPD